MVFFSFTIPGFIVAGIDLPAKIKFEINDEIRKKLSDLMLHYDFWCDSGWGGRSSINLLVQDELDLTSCFSGELRISITGNHKDGLRVTDRQYSHLLPPRGNICSKEYADLGDGEYVFGDMKLEPAYAAHNSQMQLNHYLLCHRN